MISSTMTYRTYMTDRTNEMTEVDDHNVRRSMAFARLWRQPAFVAGSQHFLDRRNSLFDFAESVVAQGDHGSLLRLFAEHAERRIRGDDLAHHIVDDQQFVDRDAA